MIVPEEGDRLVDAAGDVWTVVKVLPDEDNPYVIVERMVRTERSLRADVIGARGCAYRPVAREEGA